MTFTAVMESVDSYSETFDTGLKKLDAFFEYTKRQHEINVGRIDVTAMEGATTETDLVAMYEAESGEHSDRLKKTLEKLIKVFSEFIEDTVETMNEFMNDSQFTKTLKAADKALQSNPDLGRKTVTILDLNKVSKKFDKARAALTRLEWWGDDEDGVDDLEESITSIEDDCDEALVDAAELKISANKLVKEYGDANQCYKNSVKSSKDVITTLKKWESGSKGHDNVNVALARAWIYVEKKYLKAVTQQMKTIINALKSIAKSDAGDVTESTGIGYDEFMEMCFSDETLADQLYTEGANLKAQDEFIKQKKDIKKNFKQITKCIKSKKYKDASRLIKDTRRMVAYLEKDIDKIYDGTDDSVVTGLCGFFLRNFTELLRTIVLSIATLPVAGVGGTIYGLGAGIKDLIRVINKALEEIKGKNEIDVSVINTYKNYINDGIKQMYKALDEFEKQIGKLEDGNDDDQVKEFVNSETFGMNEDPVTESYFTVDDVFNEINELINV